MEKSPDEELNLPKYTSADIFGDASDEDEEEHAEETGTDGKKRKLIQRVWLTEQQKIEIAQHSHENPLMNQQELIDWSYRKFDLKKSLSKGAMSNLIKDKERLLKVAAKETSQHVLSMKTKHEPEFLDLENELWAWFRRNETKHAAITGDLLKMKALRIAAELKQPKCVSLRRSS